MFWFLGSFLVLPLSIPKPGSGIDLRTDFIQSLFIVFLLLSTHFKSNGIRNKKRCILLINLNVAFALTKLIFSALQI